MILLNTSKLINYSLFEYLTNYLIFILSFEFYNNNVKEI
jgi:hypothetical protein